MNEFAPILIPTLNRFEHFKRCIESLKLCTYANKTDLYIALDYPTKQEHWEGYKNIELYIGTIYGFKNVNIIKRTINYGPYRNLNEGKETIFEKYDRLIISEDDNTFSKNFLDYINKGLHKYEQNKTIWAICAYNYPVEMPTSYQHNIYFYKGFSGWGFGIWKDRKDCFYCTPDDLIQFINNKSYENELKDLQPRHIYTIKESIVNNTSLYGDSVVGLFNIMNNTYCVFPTISKVRNYGHDGSGVHGGVLKNNIFLDQKIDSDEGFIYPNYVPLNNELINQKIHQYFRITYKFRIKIILKKIILGKKLLKYLLQTNKVLKFNK